MCFKTLLPILAILPEIAAAENKRSVTRVLQDNEVCVTYKTRQEKTGPWGKGGEPTGLGTRRVGETQPCKRS